MFVVCEFGVESQSKYFWVDVHGECDVDICSSSCVLYYAGSGVKRVHVVLSGFRMRLSESMYVFHVGMIGCLILLC